MQKRRYDPQQTSFTDATLMDGETIYIYVVPNLLQLVSDQKMGRPIQ